MENTTKMKQEDKELLLKDLCARLPYGVKCRQHKLDSQVCTLCPEYLKDFDAVEEFEPYLRPMESMTKKEKKELLVYVLKSKKATKHFQVMPDGSIDPIDNEDKFDFYWVNFGQTTTSSYIDWLLKHHFDYRGLIPMGLALEAKEGMYN